MSKKDQKSKSKYIVGVDLGGTKILIGLMNSSFGLMGSHKTAVEPQRGEKVFLKSIQNGIETVLDEARVSIKEISCIGVGCPGMIQFPQGTIKLSPNIAFLKNYPLQRRLSKMFKVPVLVENDVNAGLYGEQQFGSARGHRHVIGIFLGTGVGGAMILDGRLYRGASGAAGEIGHTFLAPPSMLSSFEKSTTLEGLVGRLAISSEAALLVMKQKANHLYEDVQYDVRRIKSKMLLNSIQSGDSSVKELVLQKGRILGLAMANAVNLLNPEMIVLGGGVIEAMGHLIIPVAREVMHRYAMAPIVKNVKVAQAKLGDYSIVKGAAKLAWDVHFNSWEEQGRKRKKGEE
ncbi:MAG: ROK family protein [Candidatus Omnitrophica bacterium]|nr:ROK family protein [Candidatus Omnitrophota bacterium]